MAYTFDFIGRDGQIKHFDLGLFASDEEAAAAAAQALETSLNAVQVEVWSGERQVARLNTKRPV